MTPQQKTTMTTQKGIDIYRHIKDEFDGYCDCGVCSLDKTHQEQIWPTAESLITKEEIDRKIDECNIFYNSKDVLEVSSHIKKFKLELKKSLGLK